MTCKSGFVKALVEDLKQAFQKGNPKEDIPQILENLSCHGNACEWKKYLHFNSTRYARNLVALEDHFSLLVLCWEKGQESPIHDHAQSACWVKVLDGELAQGQFNENKKMIRKSKMLNNSIHYFDEGVGLHKMMNCSESRAISLHIYSPPYIECCDKEDMVVPVVYCGVDDEDAQAMKKYQVQYQHKLFSNFQALTELLRKEIGPTPDIPHIKKILEAFELNPKEYSQYTKWDINHYTRNLVAYDEHFTLILLCWDCDQVSPIHDHYGSSCWVKVLEGELTEVVYVLDENGVPIEKSSSTLFADGVTYIDDSIGIHKMGNTNKEKKAITLHCYAPPYQTCFRYNEGGEKERVSMAVVNQICLRPSSAPSPLLTSIESLVEGITEEFDKSPTPNPQTIKNLLQSFSFNPNEWQLYAHFDKLRYTRNLLAFNKKFSLMMICWNLGQESPIHHHNDAASWVRVIDGELQVTQMDKTNKPVKKSTLLQNSVTYFDDTFGLHTTVNPSKTATAISLHLYSPPYVECSSSIGTSIIPVVYCSSVGCNSSKKDQQISSSPSSVVPLSSSPPSSTSNPTATASFASLHSPTGDIDLLVQRQHMVFSNFHSLVDLLRKEFQSEQTSAQRLKKMIESLQFNPREWQQYACFDKKHYTRNLIAYDPSFAIYLMCWNPNQHSPIHDHHGSDCWMKILEGEIEEIQYHTSSDSPIPIQKSTFLADSVVYNDASVVHRIANASPDKQAVSLHIYSPPFDTCTAFDPCSGAKSKISCEELEASSLAQS